jgi:protein-arginine kinase activator protein McsA
MPCSICGKDNGSTVAEGNESVALCTTCINKRWPRLRIGDLSDGLRRPKAGQGQCPYCGTTDKQALDTGLVGCPLCYEALSNTIWQEFNQN